MLAHDMAILNSPNVGGVAQMVIVAPLLHFSFFFWKTEASAKAIHISL